MLILLSRWPEFASDIPVGASSPRSGRAQAHAWNASGQGRLPNDVIERSWGAFRASCSVRRIGAICRGGGGPTRRVPSAATLRPLSRRHGEVAGVGEAIVDESLVLEYSGAPWPVHSVKLNIAVRGSDGECQKDYPSRPYRRLVAVRCSTISARTQPQPSAFATSSEM